MQNPFDNSIDIAQLIGNLERRELDLVVAQAANLSTQIDQVAFVRVQGLAAFWKSDVQARFEQAMGDVLVSAHGQSFGFCYLVIGQGSRVGLYLAFEGEQAESVLRAVLTGVFPGIQLKATPEFRMGQFLKQQGFLSHRAALTGIPSTRPQAQFEPQGDARPSARSSPGTTTSDAPPHVERLLRGLRGSQWGYLVRARPLPHHSTLAQIANCTSDIGAASSLAHRQLQQLNQMMRQIDPVTQYGETQSISGELLNREAEHAVELLEAQLQRLNLGRAVGVWDVEVSLFAADEGALRRVQALTRAVFAGERSRPEPVRVFDCGSGGTHVSTQLTSLELSTLAQLPREEFPGYRVADFATFDVDLQAAQGEQPLSIGTIIDRGGDTGLPYGVPRLDLSKHALVTGVTGSGKTTTVFSLLDALAGRDSGDRRIPFLVIEPAKAEYRSLRGAGRASADAPIPELQVFTLGDETVAPFRINPFEFVIADAENAVHVQTHIDYLKSVFNAAFILYAPMPYVLEVCLHEIYEDRGWDLVSSRNRLLPLEHWGSTAEWPVFPTLSDLYAKIDEVTQRLGYEERIRMDVQAGLKARVGALMIGGKGRMLNTERSLPIKELLARPTVLELERIGNDDEKAFVIGLVLTRIYEYRRVQAAAAAQDLPFQHLLVVEEAHRLLKNVSTDIETEASNVKGHAVETFTNMLAEIRAYGQGMLFAEQIPEKLAPDALKNTNLKIVHRLVAESDRRAVAETMNMSDEQARYLSSLAPGRAIVYREGDDRPYLLQVPNFKRVQGVSKPNDAQIVAAMTPLLSQKVYHPTPDYDLFVTQQTTVFERAILEEHARQTLADEEFRELWDRVVLYAANLPDLLRPALTQLDAFIARTTAGFSRSNADVIALVYLQAATATVREAQKHYAWSYVQAEELRRDLVAGLLALAGGKRDISGVHLARFVERFAEATRRDPGPYAGCVTCNARCRFRFASSRAANEQALQQEWLAALRQQSSGQGLFDELALITREAAVRLVERLDDRMVAGVGVCISVHMAVRQRLSRSVQVQLAEELARRLW